MNFILPTTLRRRFLALSALTLLVPACGAKEPAPSAQQIQNQIAAESSGLSPFDALFGLGTVIEGTVVGKRGPEPTLLVDQDAVHIDASEEGDTPSGLPVLVLEDVSVLHVVEDRPGEEGSGRLIAAVEAGQEVELLAPAGMYDVGSRYEFWVSQGHQNVFRTRLAFDAASGRRVPGLAVPEFDARVEQLVDYTGLSRTESLLALAHEINTTSDTDPRPPLFELMFGPGPGDAAPVYPPDAYPMYEDEFTSGETDLTPVKIFVLGLEGGHYYGLQGEKYLGWFAADDHGTVVMEGHLPHAERVVLVEMTVAGVKSEFEVVDGSPAWTVDRKQVKDGALHVVVDRGPDGQLQLVSGLSGQEYIEYTDRRMAELTPGLSTPEAG